MALHALSLLTQRRLIDDIERHKRNAKLTVLPPPCPLAIAPIDFSHADVLVERAYHAACDFLDRAPRIGGPARMRMQRHATVRHSPAWPEPA